MFFTIIFLQIYNLYNNLILVQTKFVMNQILNTKLKQNKKNYKKKDWFKFQFSISIVTMSLLILGGSIYLYRLDKKEDFSDSLINNYNIYRLYSKPQERTSPEVSNNGLFRDY